MRGLREHIAETEQWIDSPAPGDDFAINIREECLLESHVVEVTADAVVIAADDRMINMLESYHMLGEEITLERIRRYGAVGSNRAQGFTVAEGDIDPNRHPQTRDYGRGDDADKVKRAPQTRLDDPWDAVSREPDGVGVNPQPPMGDPWDYVQDSEQDFRRVMELAGVTSEARSPEEFVSQMTKLAQAKPRFQVDDWVTIDPNEIEGYASSGMTGKIKELYKIGKETWAKIHVGGAEGKQTKMPFQSGAFGPPGMKVDLGNGVSTGGTTTSVPVSILEPYNTGPKGTGPKAWGPGPSITETEANTTDPLADKAAALAPVGADGEQEPVATVDETQAADQHLSRIRELAGMAEEREDREWSNRELEVLNKAERDFKRYLDSVSTPSDRAFNAKLTKKRMATDPLAGPKGQLPEQQGVAEGSSKQPRWGYHIVDQETGNSVPNTPKFKTRQEAQQYLKTHLASRRSELEVDEFQMKEGVSEGGPFSYGAKKPRKGSVADLADKKRREQERGKQPIEPRDQRVGTARVTKGVAEGSADQPGATGSVQLLSKDYDLDQQTWTFDVNGDEISFLTYGDYDDAGSRFNDPDMGEILAMVQRRTEPYEMITPDQQRVIANMIYRELKKGVQQLPPAMPPAQDMSEGVMSEVDIDLRHIAKTERMDALAGAMRGEFGIQTQQYLHDMMDEVENELDRRGIRSVDMKTKLGMLMDRIQEIYAGQAISEAEYQGRDVPLGKPMQGDVAKFKVYVKDPKTGNVKKVNFGDKTMRIKKSNPARRKSFRARHNCANPGPRTKARYWSCRKW